MQTKLRPYLTNGDVAATSPTYQSRQSRRRLQQKNGLRSHQGDVSATSPDKVTSTLFGSRGDVAAATSPRRFLVATSLRDVSGSRGDVSETFPGSRGDLAGSLHWVSARLRRRRGDVSAVADIISLRDVAATDGDVSETSRRLEKVSKKIEHV